MPNVIFDLWVYLAASPLLHLLLTLVAYLIALKINKLLGGSPVFHPVLIAMAILISLLLISGTSYKDYFEGAQFIHFLMGPAIVSLAVPLFDHRARIAKEFLPLILACLTGIFTAVFSTILLVKLLGGQEVTLLSLIPKSVTTPIGMGISEQIGGIPALTAGIVLITGAIGCVLGPLVFKIFKIEDHSIQGFALGLAAHGFGTAHCFSYSNLAGAFAGLAMGVTGLLSAFLIPLILKLVGM